VSADLARRLSRQVPVAGLRSRRRHRDIHSQHHLRSAGRTAPHWVTVPFGVPLRNVRCRVVAPSGRDCPDWVPGEFWVCGANVAAGYRNDPERTADHFVEFGGLRWYKTGDMARYWPDGTIEFLGRADNQVQIRGYRVELGEVESALRTVPGVRHAVAVVTNITGAGAPRLVAAIVVDQGEVGDIASAATAVATDLLPSYMIPTRHRGFRAASADFEWQTGLPRRRRAARIGSCRNFGRPGQRPAQRCGGRACRNHRRRAGVSSVGVHDDFFALGGDSVLATTAIARVRDWLEIDHAVVADLFATRTVAGFVERLSRREAQRGTPERLAVIAHHYLEVASMTDEEVLAEASPGRNF